MFLAPDDDRRAAPLLCFICGLNVTSHPAVENTPRPPSSSNSFDAECPTSQIGLTLLHSLRSFRPIFVPNARIICVRDAGTTDTGSPGKAVTSLSRSTWRKKATRHRSQRRLRRCAGGLRLTVTASEVRLRSGPAPVKKPASTEVNDDRATLGARFTWSNNALRDVCCVSVFFVRMSD